MARAAQRTCTSATGRQAGGQVASARRPLGGGFPALFSFLFFFFFFLLSFSSSSPLLLLLPRFSFFFLGSRSWRLVPPLHGPGEHQLQCRATRCGRRLVAHFFLFLFLSFLPLCLFVLFKGSACKRLQSSPPIHPTTAPVHRTKQLTQQAAI